MVLRIRSLLYLRFEKIEEQTQFLRGEYVWTIWLALGDGIPGDGIFCELTPAD